MRRMISPRLKDRFALLAVIALLLAAWELAAIAVKAADPRIARSKLPEPHLVAEGIVDNWRLMFDSLVVTGRGALVGLIVGIAVGLGVAVVLAQARWLERSIGPLIVGGQMIPTIALAPILLAVLQNPPLTRVAVAAYLAFFPVAVSTLRGLTSASHEQRRLMESYNAGWMSMHRRLLAPAALPFFFTGLKVAAPLSVVGQVVVELAGATSGLGYTMLAAQYFGPSFALVFWAALIVTLATGWLFYQGAVAFERWLTPWQAEFRSSSMAGNKA